MEETLQKILLQERTECLRWQSDLQPVAEAFGLEIFGDKAVTDR